MKNTRETAFQVIYKVLEEEENSHVVLRQALLQEKDAEKRDRAFVTRLVEGTLESLITLDYILNQVSKTPVKKMKPVIRTVLRMSIYQLAYMDSVPDSAVCNEAVKLVKSVDSTIVFTLKNGKKLELSGGKKQFDGIEAAINDYRLRAEDEE